MKTVAIPVLEGYRTVAAFPHSLKDSMKKVIHICLMFFLCLSFQDMSFVNVYFNKNELPKPTGQFMFLEFKSSYEYCLLPSYWYQGRLMTYQRKPEFVNLFKFCCEITTVIIFCKFVDIVFIICAVGV